MGLILKPRLIPPGVKVIQIASDTWERMERLWDEATAAANEATLSVFRSVMAGTEAGGDIGCPYCGASGFVGDPSMFDHLGKPPGGDAVYGCRACKSMLLLVPTEDGDVFRIIMAEGHELISELLRMSDVMTEEGQRISAEARDALRHLPFTTDDRSHAQ